VEGRRPVLEALRAGRRRVLSVTVQEGLAPRGTLDDILAAASAARVPVQEVAAERLSAMARTDAPQGVVARCDPLPLVQLDDVAVPAPALVAVLDGVTDPRNLGAVARSAEAAGATGLVASRHGGSPLTAAAGKAAAGALEHLPVALVAGIPAALRRLKALGLWVVALDAAGPDQIFGHHLLGEPVALVVGAEGRGAGRLVKELADSVTKIPLTGRIGSLNAAAAMSIAVFEVRRVRLVGEGPFSGLK